MPPKRRKKGLISFLDLGSGREAEHGWRLAQHRKDRPNKGKIVSVDLERIVLVDKKQRLQGQPNHRFIQGDAFKVLGKMKPQSVKVVNDSMFADLIVSENVLKLVHPLNTGSYQAIIEAQETMQESKEQLRQYVNKVFRVLAPNGRFFLTVTTLFSNVLVKEMKNAGFEISSERLLSKEEVMKGPSPTAKRFISHSEIAFEHAKEFVEAGPILHSIFGFRKAPDPALLYRPVRISARKPVTSKN